VVGVSDGVEEREVPDAESDPDGTDGGGGSRVDAEGIVPYVRWGALLALGVLAVVAAAGLYGSLSSIISVWIGERYRPIARAVFNFGVLCVAAAGMAVLLRRR
jgi:hypothetical protein